MPIFVDIKKQPDESDKGLPEIAKQIYADVNDGDSPLTAQHNRDGAEIREALVAEIFKAQDALDAQNKEDSGSSASQKTSEK